MSQHAGTRSQKVVLLNAVQCPLHNHKMFYVRDYWSNSGLC